MARAWTLGGTTLPNPHGFKRTPIETAVYHTTATGKVIKQITNRKTQYTLKYKQLTQAQIATLKALRDQDAVLAFSAEDGSLTISETNVHVNIPDELFNSKGSEFREDIDIILLEEQ